MNRSTTLLHSLTTGILTLILSPLVHAGPNLGSMTLLAPQPSVHASANDNAPSSNKADNNSPTNKAAIASTLAGTLADETAARTPSPIEKIHVLDFFDDNDNVQIILQGTFTNSCQQATSTSYTIDQERGLIELWAYSAASNSAPRPCVEGRYPFIQVVNLGQLPAADYQLTYRPHSNLSEALTIHQHSIDTPDEALYAPVDFIEVTPSPLAPDLAAPQMEHFSADTVRDGSYDINNHGNYALTLVGVFPMLYIGCMQLKKVAASLQAPDVLVIRPIAQILDNGQSCAPSSEDQYKFAASTPLPASDSATMLIHIRLPDGKALNRLLVRSAAL